MVVLKYVSPVPLGTGCAAPHGMARLACAGRAGITRMLCFYNGDVEVEKLNVRQCHVHGFCLVVAQVSQQVQESPVE